MKISLYKRHFGRHRLIKEVDVDGTFRKFGKQVDDDFHINEERLLNVLPKNFLPCEPNKILLIIEEGNGGTGVRNLKTFKPWAKYFDSYSIGLLKTKHK